MRNLRSGLACVVASLALFACGGGGTTGGGAGGPGAGSDGVSTAGTVHVGANVPGAAARAVAMISATTGTQVQGASSISVSDIPSGQTGLVMATNAHQDALLVGIFDASGGSLAAAPTPVFMASLPLGGAAWLGLTLAQTEAAIKGAAGYPALVSAVTQALQTPDSAPLQSPAVISAAGVVVQQVAQFLAAQQARSASALPPLDPPPHRLIDKKYGERLWVTDGAGAVTFWNQTELAWAAQAASVDGSQVYGTVTLPPFTASGLGAPASDMEGATSTPLAAAPEGNFIVTVGQNAQTQARNEADLEFSALWLAAMMTPFVHVGRAPEGCVFEGIRSVLGTQIPTPVASGSQLLAHARSGTLATLPAFVRQLKSCGALVPPAQLFPDDWLVHWMAYGFGWDTLFLTLFEQHPQLFPILLPFQLVMDQANVAATYWNQSFQLPLCTVNGTVGFACPVLNPVDPLPPQ